MQFNEDITSLISKWRTGDSDAEQALFDAVYSRLHQIAIQHVRSEKPSATLSATSLVHDAYLRLSRSTALEITGSKHLMALMSRVMRQLLVDRARARRAEKRDAGEIVRDSVEFIVRNDADADEIIAVHEALRKLERNGSRRITQLIELRWFAGFTMTECSQIMGVPVRTLHRDWNAARLRLREAIDGSSQTV